MAAACEGKEPDRLQKGVTMFDFRPVVGHG